MVTTRSGKDSSESSPPYRKALKAEAKKKYETRGKQRREAVPEVPRRSARLSARQNAGLQPISATPAPVPSTTTPTPTLNKRKRDVTEKDEVNVTKKQKLTLAKQSNAGKRKRAEEDEVVNSKKQKLTLAKQSDAGKRKRTDDATLIEEKTSSREIKKGRTAAPKTEIVETEVKKKEKKPSKDRRTSATKAKDVEKEVKEKEEKTEVRQSTASNAMTADKEVKEKEEETGRDLQATTDSSRPVNKGNGKAREELTGELNLARHASTSSSRYDRSTMASTSRHTLDDTKSVDGDYNTDDDLDDDSGFYFYDSFQDSKHTSKPSSGKRSNSASKKTAASLKTSSTTVMKTTSTSDEDFEDTLRSDGVRREEAGRPVQEDQRRPAVILDTNYGNGVHGRLTIREPRPVRTAEEMANRTQQEIENDATLNWFWDLTDVRDRQAMALGSRGKGGPAPRRTIE